jgi:LacI family transcriptional regulator
MSEKRRKPAGNVTRTTLKEIAQTAGVSVATVSYALSGKGAQGRISTAVVDRISEIARESGYAPNLLVRSLQSGRTHVLGLYSSFRTHPHHDLYYGRVITALEEEAGANGYNLLIYCRPELTHDEVYGALNGGLCDGVIFFGPIDNHPLLTLLRQSNLPCVLLNHEDPEGALSSVTDDWADGLRQIAERLTALGHRRIGVVTSIPDTINDAPQRVREFISCLAQYGIDVPRERIVPLRNYDPAGAQEALRALMAGDTPPTAVFCWHDLAGYYLLDACEAVGLTVPSDLSIVGYDGINWSANPTQLLATVEVDLEAQIGAAVGLIDRLIRRETTDPERRMLAVQLRVGTTLAAPSQTTK